MIPPDDITSSKFVLNFRTISWKIDLKKQIEKLFEKNKWWGDAYEGSKSKLSAFFGAWKILSIKEEVNCFVALELNQFS